MLVVLHASLVAADLPIKLVHQLIDGGVKVDNIAEIVAAGADTLVAGSAVFGAPDNNGGYTTVMGQLRRNARAT